MGICRHDGSLWSIRGIARLHTGYMEPLCPQRIGDLSTRTVDSAGVDNHDRDVLRPVRTAAFDFFRFLLSRLFFGILLRNATLRALRFDGRFPFSEEFLSRGKQFALIRLRHHAQTLRCICSIDGSILLCRLLHRRRKIPSHTCKQFLACLHDIWNPIAHVPEICRSSRNHLHIHAGCFDILQPFCECQQLPRRQICLNGSLHLIHHGGKTRKHLRRQELREKSTHKALLASNAADIPLSVAITHILDCVCTVHMLLSGGEINHEAAVIVPRILIVHPLLHVNVHAADRIYDSLECRRIDHDIMRHRNTNEFADRGERHLVPAECIGVIDLVIAVAADLDTRIPRYREQRSTPVLLIDGSQHQCITASDIPLPPIHSHNEHITQIVLRQIGKCIPCPQRSGHKIAARIVNGTDKQKGKGKYSPCIFDKCTILLRLRCLFPYQSVYRPLPINCTQYNKNKSSMQIQSPLERHISL